MQSKFLAQGDPIDINSLLSCRSTGTLAYLHAYLLALFRAVSQSA